MSRKKPPRAHDDAAGRRPPGGGSYVRDRKTGALERVAATEQRQPRPSAEPEGGAGGVQQNSEPAGNGQQEG